jgi:hypothetical protein
MQPLIQSNVGIIIHMPGGIEGVAVNEQNQQ